MLVSTARMLARAFHGELRFEAEQIGVARNDQIGLRGQRTSEHVIVVGVA